MFCWHNIPLVLARKYQKQFSIFNKLRLLIKPYHYGNSSLQKEAQELRQLPVYYIILALFHSNYTTEGNTISHSDYHSAKQNYNL